MSDLLEQLEADALEHEFIEEIGVRFESFEDGVLMAQIPYNQKYANPDMDGTIHGGVVASMLDTVMGYALQGVLNDEAGASLGPTVTLTTNFVGPARGPLTGTAEVVRAGVTTAVLKGSLRDAESGDVVATGQGVWRIYRQ